MSLGVLLQIFSGGLRSVGVSASYTRAIALAELQMASLATEPLTVGTTAGEFDTTFNWRIERTPIDIPIEDGPPAAVVIPSALGLMGITVTVEWSEGRAAPRRVVLHSARIFNKAPGG